MTSAGVPQFASRRAGALSWLCLLAGVLAGQSWLYWPSLTGRCLLAPTDLLTVPGDLNVVGSVRGAQAQHVMMDPVQVFLPWQDFAAREVRAGRLPTWNPYAYCGSPFLANMQSAVYSPFTAVYYVWSVPLALAWVQVFKALVAGAGTFGFFREIGVRRLPALVGGWCFPLSGYLTVWLNYPLSAAAVWLPAGMWCVASVLRRPKGTGGPALAAVVGLMLVSGHLETTAHALFGMAIFGLWSWLADCRGRVWDPQAVRVAQVTALALALGLLLGAAQVLPTLDYVRSSHRLRLRQQHQIERAYARETLRWEAARIAFPWIGGAEQPGTRPLTRTGLHESGANAYAGATLLLLVPIGLAARGRRSERWPWLFLAVWFAAPMFQIPGLKWWDHLPPFHLAANSRALLLTGWAILVLGVYGLDALGDPQVVRRWSVLVACGIAAVLLAGLLAGALDPSGFRRSVPSVTWPWFHDHLVQSAAITGLVLVALAVWLLVPPARRCSQVVLGLLAVGELLANAHGLNPQVDPAMFYPESPLCRFLAGHVGDGRICGLWGALPPNLAMMYRLRDVRGYDAVDPDPFVELLQATRGHLGPTHALTWQLACGPSPLLDMLSARFFILPMRRTEFGEPTWEQAGAVVYANPRALPRAFVPRQAVRVPEPAERLRRLSAPSFDPRREALISAATSLPTGAMSGSASIVGETPERIEVETHCATDAVVVLGDSWSPDWTVTVDGRRAEPLQANHALRAVVVPTGEHRVVWRYRPKAVLWGIGASAVGLTCLAALAIAVARRQEGPAAAGQARGEPEQGAARVAP